MAVVRSETLVDILPFSALFSFGDVPKSVKPQSEVSFRCFSTLDGKTTALAKGIVSTSFHWLPTTTDKATYSKRSPSLLSLPNVGMAALARDHLLSSHHLQTAHAMLSPKKKQWEVSPQFLGALLVVTMTHRQLCLYQRLKEINFWPSFIAQIFGKLVLKSRFGSHFSKFGSSNWVQWASWESIIFIIFLLLALLKLENSSPSLILFVAMVSEDDGEQSAE